MGWKRRTGKARLLEHDGVGRVEISTSQRLESYTWARPEFDREMREWLWTEGVRTPEEFLRGREAGGFQATKEGGAERWRYLGFQAGAHYAGSWSAPGVKVEPEHYMSVRRALDLWDGSGDRRVLQLMVGQSTVPIVWIKEEIVNEYAVTDRDRDVWSQVLLDTNGVSKAQWLEERAEQTWRASESWQPGPRPRTYRRRKADIPDPPVLFFAARSGPMPARGAPELAGRTLPRGRRYPRGLPAAYWCSDEAVTDLAELVPTLCRSFPESGVWPLLWSSSEDPDSYMGGHGLWDAIDSVDLPTVLAENQRKRGRASDPKPHSDSVAATRDRAHVAGPGFIPAWALQMPARLLLVPCNRPADAITALGGVGNAIDTAVITALVRSWEQRFFAVPYEVGPGLVRLAVAHPPADRVAALELAGEIHAISTDSSDLLLLPPTAIADDVLSAPTPETRSGLSRHAWDIGL